MGGGRSNHSVRHCAKQYGDFSENHVNYCGMQRGLCCVYTPRALGVGSQRDLHSHIHSHIVHNVGPPKCPTQMNPSTKYGQIDTSEGRSLHKGEEFQQAHTVVWITLEDMLNKSGGKWILAQGTQQG